MKPREPSVPASPERSPGESPAASLDDTVTKPGSSADGAVFVVSCILIVLGSMLTIPIRRWWISLTTPWVTMGLIGLLVGAIVFTWAQRYDDNERSSLAAVFLGGLAFAAATVLSMQALYAANGFFDHGALTPCRVVVVSAAPNLSLVRIELPTGPIERLIEVSVHKVQNGDAFTLHVGRGALGIPWYRRSEIEQLPYRYPLFGPCDVGMRPSGHQETPQ